MVCKWYARLLPLKIPNLKNVTKISRKLFFSSSYLVLSRDPSAAELPKEGRRNMVLYSPFIF